MQAKCCRVCLEKENLKVFYPKNMRSPLKEVFPYLHCSSCQSLSIKTIPEDLALFYENYYSFLTVTPEQNKLRKIAIKLLLSKPKWLSAIFARLLNEPNDLAMKALRHCGVDKKMKILDIGCGSGRLVSQLFEAGAKEAIGIDAFLGTDATLPNGSKIFKREIFEEKGKWDVIMLHHVFEHMADPNFTLQKLQSILAEKGSIIIRVPNVDSYAFKLFQEKWFGIQAPIHIFLPSIQGMKKMLDLTGWEIKNIFGENLLKLWEYNLAYSLDIGHHDDLGNKVFSNSKISKELIFKGEYKYWKNVNRKIMKQPNLCDWIVYHIKRKNGS